MDTLLWHYLECQRNNQLKKTLLFYTATMQQNIFKSECYNYRIFLLSEKLMHLLNYKNPSTQSIMSSDE